MASISLPIEKIIVSCSYCALFVQPNLYRLLTFHVPNRMSLFCFLKLRDTPSGNTPPRRTEWGSSPDSFVSRGSISCCEYFLTGVFSREGVVSTSPNPQAGGPPLVGCPRLLIRFIHSYPPYWRPFLHPQPEDAPCRGDRDPHSWSLVELCMLNVYGMWDPSKGKAIPLQ